MIEAAYRHGFRTVEFVHGAADVQARGTPGYGAAGEGDRTGGRGDIKRILRERLYRGRWRAWAQDRREGNHMVLEGSMSIALLENPAPDPGARWPVVPPPAY